MKVVAACFEILEVETLEESYSLESKRFQAVAVAINTLFPRVFYLCERWKSVSLPIHI